MANKTKPTHAERAAAGANKKNSPDKKNNAKPTPPDPEMIPIRWILGIGCLGMFIFFLIMAVYASRGVGAEGEGVFLRFLYNFTVGMIGKAGFYLAIPSSLCLFVILTFSGQRPVMMRSLCLVAFVLLISCITHLVVPSHNLGSGLHLLGDLYTGGSSGMTGGIICGLIAIGLSKLLFRAGALIVLIILTLLSLLAVFEITIPSLIRAVENRPRAEWENKNKEPVERPEPATVVVNHLATKRIAYIENRRRHKDENAGFDDIDIPLDGEKKRRLSNKLSPEARELIRQIDDIGSPVCAGDNNGDKLDEKTFLKTEGKPTSPADGSGVHPAPAVVVEEEVDILPELVMKNPPSDPAHDKVTAKEARASAVQVAAEVAKAAAAEKPIYCFPPINLLHPPRRGGADGTAEMKENTRRLNEALASFKIEACIVNVTRGPSVTRYEVELEKGVRLSKLTAVADDIALSLGASSVRIAPVPDKISVVGIEVPNRAVTMVPLREVIDSQDFARAKAKSSFAVGKDIGGKCIVGNIAKLPHMLIAGTTGSGKSVCMNSIIISLLYKASPDDVKLIMIDPKMVELGIYNGIPHLLIPVVTDPKKAAGSLQWAVTEMMRRYKYMSDAGVRDLDSYNSIMESEEGTKLPQIVVIIDELADLMLVAAKEVEESICRIAQMGRAAGIHLIIATQRPSADVITGLMKANIPSRIAFSVASAMESRIILDTQGAEKLVGRGDMLFAPIGNGKPLRVQGCFVDDDEVEAVASYVKENYITHYDQTVMDEIEQKAVQTGNKAAPVEVEANSDESEGDEMLPAAVEVILETGQASVSMLQRRLKLGYARAARIVDEMEDKGIVGPFKGAKPREILVTKEQWDAMRGITPATDEAETDFSAGLETEEI